MEATAAASTPLHHFQDFKLIFKVLAGTNGRISMDTLTSYANTMLLPKDCLLYWQSAASQDGTLTQEGFLKGFQGAAKADETFGEMLSKQKLRVEGVCTTDELEGLLMHCNQRKLATALSKSRRELHNSQYMVAELETATGGNDKQMMKRKTDPKQAESEVLLQLEQMLRSRRNDDRFVAKVMIQLTDVLKHPFTDDDLATSWPTTHPFATIRRSKSVKDDNKLSTDASSLSKSYTRLQQVQHDIESEHSSVKLMRSTSFPGKKGKKHGHQQKQQPNRGESHLVPTINGEQSKSMHNLVHSSTPAPTTKEMLVGWMESRIMQPPHNPPPPQRTYSQQHINGSHHHQQHPPLTAEAAATGSQLQHQLKYRPTTAAFYNSTPNVANYPPSNPVIGNRQMTANELAQAEQYATLRHKHRHSAGKGGVSQTLSVKTECKSQKSDYIAEIHRLRSEKEALIKQLFEQQASTNKLDDSLMSVL